MSTSKEAFLELRKKKEELEKEFQNISKAFFAEQAKELFEKHGTVQSITWKQYTPYFNDGDACTFRVCSDEIDVTYKVGDLEPHTEEYVSGWQIKNYFKTGLDWQKKPFSPTLAEWAAADFVPFLQQFEDDLLLSMFGDHVKVTIHRDGAATVNEFNHD